MALVGLDGNVDVAIQSDVDGSATDRMRASFSVEASASADPVFAGIAIAADAVVSRFRAATPPRAARRTGFCLGDLGVVMFEGWCAHAIRTSTSRLPRNHSLQQTC
jgi:hypothetical protein